MRPAITTHSRLAESASVAVVPPGGPGRSASALQGLRVHINTTQCDDPCPLARSLATVTRARHVAFCLRARRYLPFSADCSRTHSSQDAGAKPI